MSPSIPQDKILPSDAALAALVNGLYRYPHYPVIAFDHIEAPASDEGICWALKRLGDIDIIILRGSKTPEDWLRDFEAIANPFDHSFLGPVHPGFLAGMEDAFAAMKPLLGPHVIVAGHSLGAARAAILTGLMVHAWVAPLACVTFGQPRPGFPPLAKLIAGVAQRSYRNGNGIVVDMITEVPLALGLEDYVHPHALTDVREEPGPSWIDQFGVFAWHSMPLYLRALETLDSVPPSGPIATALMPDGAPPAKLFY